MNRQKLTFQILYEKTFDIKLIICYFRQHIFFKEMKAENKLLVKSCFENMIPLISVNVGIFSPNSTFYPKIFPINITRLNFQVQNILSNNVCI